MLRFRARRANASRPVPTPDQRVRQLTVQADVIVEELSEIVAQIGALLREKAEASDTDPSP